ncbi:MAG: C2H2-type zinc finger protein [Candidatus Odinarchaeota archaeon]
MIKNDRMKWERIRIILARILGTVKPQKDFDAYSTIPVTDHSDQQFLSGYTDIDIIGKIESLTGIRPVGVVCDTLGIHLIIIVHPRDKAVINELDRVTRMICEFFSACSVTLVSRFDKFNVLKNTVNTRDNWYSHIRSDISSLQKVIRHRNREKWAELYSKQFYGIDTTEFSLLVRNNRVSRLGGKYNNVYTCKYCSRYFLTPHSLYKHLSKDHGKYTCPHCLLIYKDREELKEHSKNVHNNPCPSCGVTFADSSFLKQHILAKHGDFENCESETPCECPDCNKPFVDSYALWQHRLSKHGHQIERGFVIHQCERVKLEPDLILDTLEVDSITDQI